MTTNAKIKKLIEMLQESDLVEIEVKEGGLQEGER